MNIIDCTSFVLGIVIAILLVLILGAIIVALILVALSIRKKKNFSKHFRESHIRADYESRQVLVLRSSREEGESWPGIHCMHMRSVTQILNTLVNHCRD